MTKFLTLLAVVFSFVIHVVLAERLHAVCTIMMGECYYELQPISCIKDDFVVVNTSELSVTQNHDNKKWCCVKFLCDDEASENSAATHPWQQAIKSRQLNESLDQPPVVVEIFKAKTKKRKFHSNDYERVNGRSSDEKVSQISDGNDSPIEVLSSLQSSSFKTFNGDNFVVPSSLKDDVAGSEIEMSSILSSQSSVSLIKSTDDDDDETTTSSLNLTSENDKIVSLNEPSSETKPTETFTDLGTHTTDEREKEIQSPSMPTSEESLENLKNTVIVEMISHSVEDTSDFHKAQTISSQKESERFEDQSSEGFSFKTNDTKSSDVLKEPHSEIESTTSSDLNSIQKHDLDTSRNSNHDEHKFSTESVTELEFESSLEKFKTSELNTMLDIEEIFQSYSTLTPENAIEEFEASIEDILNENFEVSSEKSSDSFIEHLPDEDPKSTFIVEETINSIIGKNIENFPIPTIELSASNIDNDLKDSPDDSKNFKLSDNDLKSDEASIESTKEFSNVIEEEINSNLDVKDHFVDFNMDEKESLKLESDVVRDNEGLSISSSSPILSTLNAIVSSSLNVESENLGSQMPESFPQASPSFHVFEDSDEVIIDSLKDSLGTQKISDIVNEQLPINEASTNRKFSIKDKIKLENLQSNLDNENIIPSSGREISENQNISSETTEDDGNGNREMTSELNSMMSNDNKDGKEKAEEDISDEHETTKPTNIPNSMKKSRNNLLEKVKTNVMM
ncbi:CLUMA_CG012120, isoform A [Clunio marinus]|uniref:CLUMA_CG012120, isoform A n=1 Tax=Clunio marinus TaxID=568069 RepID=A0A1J1IF55_9DIPT|nr:CLUMA_CG012120, isoform A [Clunio marinus]